MKIAIVFALCFIAYAACENCSGGQASECTSTTCTANHQPACEHHVCTCASTTHHCNNDSECTTDGGNTCSYNWHGHHNTGTYVCNHLLHRCYCQTRHH